MGRYVEQSKSRRECERQWLILHIGNSDSRVKGRKSEIQCKPGDLDDQCIVAPSIFGSNPSRDGPKFISWSLQLATQCIPYCTSYFFLGLSESFNHHINVNAIVALSQNHSHNPKIRLYHKNTGATMLRLLGKADGLHVMHLGVRLPFYQYDCERQIVLLKGGAS